MPEDDSHCAIIKWKYASGNINNRYRMIVLRPGKGLAGLVIRTGARKVIADVEAELSQNDKLGYPIVLSEVLTAMIAIPLWKNNRVYGALLLGQRKGRPLPAGSEKFRIQSRLGVLQMKSTNNRSKLQELLTQYYLNTNEKMVFLNSLGEVIALNEAAEEVFAEDNDYSQMTNAICRRCEGYSNEYDIMSCENCF